MEMERLDYRLPESTRVQWVSGKTRDVWEPRLSATVNALHDMELQSVVAGMRSACILSVDPYDFPAKAAELLALKIGVLPLHRAGDAVISTNPPADGDPWNYLVLA